MDAVQKLPEVTRRIVQASSLLQHVEQWLKENKPELAG